MHAFRQMQHRKQWSLALQNCYNHHVMSCYTLLTGVDLSKILGGGNQYTGEHRRRLVQNIGGGARSGQSAMTDDIIGVSGATYKLVRFLYSAVHTYIHVLQQ